LGLVREADSLKPIGPEITHVAPGSLRRDVIKAPLHDPSNIEKIV
jgi:hypothetical protein